MTKTTEAFFLEDGFAPITKEIKTSNITARKGKIPSELDGTFYRIGPNPQFPSENAHWFEGDGMVHALQIKDGKLSYQNRWVETERFLAEKQAGRRLFGTMSNPQERDPSVKDASGATANTNLIMHAGKLLALQETSPAIELVPSNLDTLGKWKYDGKLVHMTAHPHTNHSTGNMHTYCYEFGSTEIIYGIVDPDGNAIKTEKFEAPYSCFLHDFFITEHYAIFPIMPLTFSIERAQLGKPVFAWEPKKSAHIALLPHNGTAEDIIWIETEAFYSYHFMNAFEEDGQIILDTMRSSAASLFPLEDGSLPELADTLPYLTRYRFNLKTKNVSFEKLSDISAEFPRTDERYVGRPYQHGYCAALLHGKEEETHADTLIRYDLKNKTHTLKDFGANNCVSEPVFVPRSEDAAEGDGFLLSIIYDHKDHECDLYILDAQHIDKEPVAVVRLPQRIPLGFHGNWVGRHK